MYKKKWGTNVLEHLCSKEKFIELYNANSVTDLAKMFKLTRQTVIKMAKKYELPHKPNGGTIRKHKEINIDLEGFRKLYRTTRTKDLAKAFNVSTTTLIKIAKEKGIELKKPGFRLN